MSQVSEASPPVLNTVTSAPPFAALTGRVLLAALFVLSGVEKVLDPQVVIEQINATGLPFPELGFAGAVAIELGGSAALLAGYRTRLAAAGMALFCVVTAALFHNQWSDKDQFLHFFKDIAIAGGLLQVTVFGAGAWSLDARRGTRSTS